LPLFLPVFVLLFLFGIHNKYAILLANKIKKHQSSAWLVNTGWTGGAYGTGSRIKLAYTRAIIHAIQNGDLEKVATTIDPEFGFAVPVSCPGVPAKLLQPRKTWADKNKFEVTKEKLIRLFQQNFKQFESQVSLEISEASPKLGTSMSI